MEHGKLWDDFSSLTPEAQRQVADFIAFLRHRDALVRRKQRVEAQSLDSEPFVGMWRDRADLQDSSTWLRTVRKEEWRDGGG